MKRNTEAFKKENLAILAILIIIFLITLGIYLFFTSISMIKEENSQDESSIITVTRIIDGDTFEISSGEKIRLLCVDTPEENQEGYEEAKQFLSDLILNKQVRFESDKQDKDNYRILLRYVYVNQSGSSCTSTQENNPQVLSANVCLSIGTSSEILVNKEMIDKSYGKLFEYDNTCEKVKND
jgi:endonuclease YncB( thermonuclease family)